MSKWYKAQLNANVSKLGTHVTLLYFIYYHERKKKQNAAVNAISFAGVFDKFKIWADDGFGSKVRESPEGIQLALEGTWEFTDIHYSLRDVCQNHERYLIVVPTSMAIHPVAVQICQVFANNVQQARIIKEKKESIREGAVMGWLARVHYAIHWNVRVQIPLLSATTPQTCWEE